MSVESDAVLKRAEKAYRAVIALPGTLGPEVCALVESHYELVGALHQAAPPAASPAGGPAPLAAEILEEAAKVAEFEHSVGTNGLGIAAAIRHLAAHPKWRATPSAVAG